MCTPSRNQPFRRSASSSGEEILKVCRWLMRRRRHEQQMPGELAEKRLRVDEYGVLDLIAKEGGRYFRCISSQTTRSQSVLASFA